MSVQSAPGENMLIDYPGKPRGGSHAVAILTKVRRRSERRHG